MFAERVRRIPPAGIVLAGWLGVMLYGLPGYLPPEAIRRLSDARRGHYGDVSAVVWRVVDTVVPGPFGMLVLQTACFAIGAYLVLRHGMAARRAAIATLVILWFPPVAATLAVIWPESLATAWLMLGTAAVLSERPWRRIAGLVVLALAGAILEGGALVVLPLALAFTGRGHTAEAAQRDAAAQPSAAAARPDASWSWSWRGAGWLGVPAALLTAALAFGIASRFPPPRADRSALIADPALGGSQAYVWFADVHDHSTSAGSIQHDARASHLQNVLQPAMRWLGATPLFDPRVYAVLALLLVPLVRRRRPLVLAIAAGTLAYAAAWRAGHPAELHFALWPCVAAALAVAALRRDGASSS